MSFLKQLTAAIAIAAMLAPMAPLQARTRKGDKFLVQGRAREAKNEWDAALEAYEKSLAEDPSDIVYRMAADKARFQAGQAHTDRGMKLRSQGQLGEALLEFQKGYTLNPGSSVAQQELIRTREMIERERRRVEQTGKESAPEERALTPVDQMKKDQQEKIQRMLPVPELRPLNPQPIDIKMNGQRAKVIFETLGKIAGINVLWDPDYQPPAKDNLTIEFSNSSIEQALDYAAILTKSYWKPLGTNTIFITNDNPNKRRDYEEQVTRVFYLNNVSAATEIQEIVGAVRGVGDLQRVFAFNSQNAILVRAESDKVALAEKIIRDLDKPRSEVIVDILVMEANSVFSRQLTTALASTGLNVPFTFKPRSSIATTTTSTSTTTTTDPTIGLNSLTHLSTSDFSTTLPSALLEAVLSDTKTKILQSPQVRSVDNMKATMKIGDKVPTATGTYTSTTVTSGVSTQFQYIDVGVNVDLTPHVHDNGDVSMHIELEVSTVSGHVTISDVSEPIISQRKIIHDIRMREGEVGLLGGLVSLSDTKAVTGIPGLSSIPLLRRLFTGDSVDHNRDELMIAIVPHIIRRPEVSLESLRSIAVGNATSVHLNYAPKKVDAPAAPGPKAAVRASDRSPVVTAPAVPASAPLLPPATAPVVMTPPATAPPATAPAPGTAPGPPPTMARVAFSQSQVESTLTGGFSVALVIDNGTDVTSAPLKIQFDPKVVRLNDVIRGDYMAHDGLQPVFTRDIQNDLGFATVELKRPAGAPGVGGAGTLVLLNFQSVGRGSTTVTVPGFAARNSAGQVVVSATPEVTVNVK